MEPLPKSKAVGAGESPEPGDKLAQSENGQTDGRFPVEYTNALPERYELIRMIGHGGMAEVFLAEDKRLARQVAIKFLSGDVRRDHDRMRRFAQEARAASALNHPNILTIHDIGEKDGVQFIVAEFIQGETLGTRISRGRLPVDEAVTIAVQIASALAASHDAGIVHRDMKPDNVMIRRDGSVKVLDFGLAKETGTLFTNDADFDAKTLDRVSTSPGLVLGTPQYMSPEQARGNRLDARTDIFSLGIILFEMVTGTTPFPGETVADIISAIIGKEPRMLEEFLDEPPLGLIRIVKKALRKNEAERYGTMAHLLSDLKDLQAELRDTPYTAAETQGEQPRQTRPNTRRLTQIAPASVKRGMLALVAVAGVVAVALAAWWYTGTSGALTPPAGTAMRAIPITSWSSSTGEVVIAASFSPDAKMIAFGANRTGASEIWLKPSVGGEPIQVTRNADFSQYPVWSPNGQEIAFFLSRGQNRGIWRTSFTGGEQVQIISDVGPTTRTVLWSEEGKIYFQDASELFSVDTKTGAKAQVTDFAARGISPRKIEISADGKQVAYSVKADGGFKVMIEAVGSARSAEVASSKELIDYLAWDPDGKTVIFSSASDGAYQAFRTGIDYEEPVQLSNGNLDFFVEDVSKDGTRILYGSTNETSDLWRVDVANGQQSIVANDIATEFWPDISPDGKSVAYQSMSQADRPFRGSINMKVIGAQGLSTIVSSEGFAPTWSPDGQWIAFFRRAGDQGMAIWRVRATGGDAVQLVPGGAEAPTYMPTPYLKAVVEPISWSPDGAWLAYPASDAGVRTMRITSFDGTRSEVVSQNAQAGDVVSGPIWSQDGGVLIFSSLLQKSESRPQNSYRLCILAMNGREQRVIFESSQGFRFLGLDAAQKRALIVQRADPADTKPKPSDVKVLTIALEGGAKTEVATLRDAFFNNIYLSPDGETIAFTSRRGDATTLWTVAATGGTPKQVLVENDPKVLINALTWSPDNGSIIFGKQTRTSLLSMLAQ
jgi:serine/threonine protein kinase/Tol biopolymer transport system component